MTAILIDQFNKNTLYIFADGLATAGDIVVENQCKKIFDTENDNDYFYHTFCGDVGVPHYYANKLTELGLEKYTEWFYDIETPVNYKKADISLISVIQNKSNKKIQIVITEKKEDYQYIEPLSLQTLPYFMGSGNVALKAAYLASNVDHNKGDLLTEYLDQMEEVYDCAARVITSMGPLVSTVKVKFKP